MIPGNADYPIPYKREDTIDERIFTMNKIVNSVPQPIILTDVVIKCTFKQRPYGQVTYDKTLGAGLTLIDASLGKFKIDAWQADECGEYDFDIDFLFPSGIRRTYLSGLLTINDDITK